MMAQLILSILQACGTANAGPGSASVSPFQVAGRSVLEVAGIDAPQGFTLASDGNTLIFEGVFPSEGEGPGAQMRLQHMIAQPRHVWVPHLAPAPGYVIGDHAFRSPAVILADDKLALALVPDLDDVGRGYQAGWRTWLDYDHPSRTITLAAGNYRVAEHVLYKSAPLAYAGQTVRLRCHVLTSTDPDDVRNPYGMVARWIWQRWGHAGYHAGTTQEATVRQYAGYIFRWALSPEGWGETVWQEFTIDGRRCGAPAFIVDVAQHPSVPMEQRRWREPLSIWNQAWFSTQRCANGLLRYARQIGSDELAERAHLSTQIALAAPQSDGLFPAVYTTRPRSGGGHYMLYKDTPGWDQGRWTNSDRRPPQASEDACHILDAAFTARLLLEWDQLVGGNAETLAYVTRLADRLCRLQRPGGAFPGWVEPDGRVVEVLAEGPESAMSATLLLELYRRDPSRDRYRDAARKALAYLETGPVAEGRWEDYETYFSCCRWGFPEQLGRRVERNGVYKQNTLSPFWCAEAFLEAYRVFGDAKYLQLGMRCLDELSLFQQVWDPPFIIARCHGGFGVMNADGEWNDARQSLFAPLYLAYYDATGRAEYFERGVSALRASFAMLYCPENVLVRRQYELKYPFFGPESFGFMMENIAHGGPAPPDGSAIGPFTIFTWGNGAALAAAATIRDLYGDVYIDDARGQAFGIDGCRATLDESNITIENRFERDALTVVVLQADGTRRVSQWPRPETRLILKRSQR